MWRIVSQQAKASHAEFMILVLFQVKACTRSMHKWWELSLMTLDLASETYCSPHVWPADLES
jgi:hypothetical protein